MRAEHINYFIYGPNKIRIEYSTSLQRQWAVADQSPLIVISMKLLAEITHFLFSILPD